jgi:hypothetical protein
MNDVVTQLPEILETAAASRLGILALMIVALSLLGFFFFREASERARLASFALLFIGTVMFGFAVVGEPGPSGDGSTGGAAQQNPAEPSAGPSRPAETAPEPAPSRPPVPVPEPPAPVTHSFTVRKGPGGAPLNTRLTLNAGDELTITGRGEIRSGVFGTGTNGPRGWYDAALPGDRVAAANFPLPGAPPYSLIAGYDNARWLLVGDSMSTKYTGPAATLWLSINDAVQGRGEGAFDVQVRLQRRR